MQTAIEGTWEMIRAELDGETAPELVAAKTVLELAAGTYQVRFDDTPTDRGTFELGTTTNLKTLLLRGLTGVNAGRTIPCIYQRRGDLLRVCFGLAGVAPADFTTAPGQQRYLGTYRLKSPAQRN